MGSCCNSEEVKKQTELRPTESRPAKKQSPAALPPPHHPSTLQKPTQTPAIAPSQPKVQQQPEAWGSLPAFLQAIRQEIKDNKSIYGQFLDIEEIFEIIHVIQTRFVDQSTAETIINIVLDFLSYCKIQTECQPALLSSFTKDYPQELAEKWLRIREETFLYNKGHLKVLNYIVENPNSGKSQFGGSFMKLSFDLSEKEAKEVAAIGYKMAKEDVRSFCFLLNYLLLSCKTLQKKGEALKQISSRFQQIVLILNGIYRPAPQIIAEGEQFEQHKSYFRKDQIPTLEVNLQGLQKPQEALDNFIMERAEEALNQKQRFTDLMKSMCDKNGGFHFKIGVKIQKKSQHNALLRIKEKMLAALFNETQLEKDMNVSQIESFSIDQSVIKEKQTYELKMAKIFQNLNRPIRFEVDDMLRAKCLFADVAQINKCCSDILCALQKQENKDLKVIKLDNRLKNPTSDLVLKILFGSTIAEFQMAINLNAAEYQFNHKIYELKRSQFFTKLTQLSILTEQLSSDYFSEIKTIIASNTRIEAGQNYEELTTYAEVALHFDNFLAKLPVKIDPSQNPNHEISLTKMVKAQQMLKSVVQSKKESGNLQKHAMNLVAWTRLNEGKYYFYMKQLKKAEKKLKQAQQVVEKGEGGLNGEEKGRIRTKIHSTIGDVYREKGQYMEAMLYYQKIQKNIQGEDSIDVLLRMGAVYDHQGDFNNAIQYYLKCVSIAEQNKGSDAIKLIGILSNIGLIYKKYGDLPTAINYYNHCLELQEKLFGKGSIQTALTLNNIGMVYDHQGDSHKAIEYLQKSLQISQRVKGKGSLDTVLPLNNIGEVYEGQGDFERAMQYLSKCLQIQERIKGKGSIDTAVTLNNIGIIYMKRGEYPKAREYIQRCKQIQEEIKGVGSIDTILPLNARGNLHNEQGEYLQAIECYKKCLQIQKKLKNTGSIDSASFINNIGMAYHSLGESQKAIAYLNQGLGIIKEIKKEGSIDFAGIYSNIGSIYEEQGDFEQALLYFDKCRQILEKIKSKNSIDTAKVYNNIGMTYSDLEDYPKAIEFFQKSLQIYEKAKQSRSIDATLTLSNIGNAYYKNGNLPEAEQSFLKCLSAMEEMKGRGKLDKTVILTDIGMIYQKMGKISQALEYFQKCLQIQQKGEEKGLVTTASTLGCIAQVYYTQQDYAKAMDLLQKSLLLKEKEKGKGHFDTAQTIFNIAIIYNATGQYPKALQHFNKCLQIQQKAKGVGNIETAQTLNKIANIYFILNQLPQALTTYTKCIQILTEKQKTQTLEMADILNHMGVIYKRMGKFKEAIQFLDLCLQIQQKIKGKGNIETALTLSLIGLSYKSLGDLPHAIKSYIACLQIQERILGEKTIETGLTLNNIGMAYKAFGVFTQAAEYLSRSAAIFFELSNTQYTQISANALIECYFHMGRHDQSLSVATKYKLFDQLNCQ